MTHNNSLLVRLSKHNFQKILLTSREKLKVFSKKKKNNNNYTFFMIEASCIKVLRIVITRFAFWLDSIKPYVVQQPL